MNGTLFPAPKRGALGAKGVVGAVESKGRLRGVDGSPPWPPLGSSERAHTGFTPELGRDVNSKSIGWSSGERCERMVKDMLWIPLECRIEIHVWD
jgi:hypothetical protein